MVCLDKHGGVVRELGARAWADPFDSVPAASFTITKQRWLVRHEPRQARTAAVCRPHGPSDWWRGPLTGRAIDRRGRVRSARHRPEAREYAAARAP